MNAQESMGKPCKYMQFIKHAFVTHSTASECMCNEIEGSYDKTIITTVSSYTGKMSLVCCCCIVTHVAHLYNRDSIKFTSGTSILLSKYLNGQLSSGWNREHQQGFSLVRSLSTQLLEQMTASFPFLFL